MQLYPTSDYHASEKWPYAIAAGCLVYRQTGSATEVLLLVREGAQYGRSQNQSVSYHLPKGHLNVNETLQACAERETNEEAGCTVRVLTYLGVVTDEFIHPNTKLLTVKTVHYFAGLWESDVQAMDNEHSAKVWMSLDEAEQRLGQPNPKGEDELIRRLRKFLELASVS